MEKVIDFLKDVKVELSKVNWPTKDQTIRYTFVVIGLSVFLAVFLGFVDYGLEFGLTKFLLK